MYYGLSKELLSNKDTDLLVNIRDHYLQKFHIWHMYIMIYYPQAHNNNVNFNTILGDILIKYLAL